MNFEDQKIDKQIVKILKDNNIIYMTPIQHKTVPLILNGHDILGISSTGTGKTFSFLVPILHNLLNTNKSFYCLIITPTRELALQIDKTVKLFKSLGVKSLALIGGEKIEDQLNQLKTHPHIVIGTPGRLHKIGKNLKINRFRVLVLDEADKLIDLGFKEKVLNIVSFLPKSKSCGFFSATINENVKNLSKLILKNPIFVKSEGSEIPNKLKICYLKTKYSDKLLTTLDLIKNKKSIVFFATCNQVDFFYKFLIRVKNRKRIKILRLQNEKNF